MFILSRKTSDVEGHTAPANRHNRHYGRGESTFRSEASSTAGRAARSGRKGQALRSSLRVRANSRGVRQRRLDFPPGRNVQRKSNGPAPTMERSAPASNFAAAEHSTRNWSRNHPFGCRARRRNPPLAKPPAATSSRWSKRNSRFLLLIGFFQLL
jgi:hypothetical protein